MTRTDDTKSPQLIRGLGFWAAIALVVGSVIGQAIFLVASDVARELGSITRVLTVWIVGGIVVLLGAFCFAELGAAMPRAGGAYVYLSRGLSPVWGFIYGWTSAMIMGPGSYAVIAAGLSAPLVELLSRTLYLRAILRRTTESDGYGGIATSREAIHKRRSTKVNRFFNSPACSR